MNKVEFIAAIAEKSGLSKAEAESATSAFLDVVKETLLEGDQISLVGFGTFKTKNRSARMGRNPKTGQEIEIAASVVPELKFGKPMKDALN